MGNWWTRAKPALIANIIYFFVRIVGVTLRVRHEGSENLAPSAKGKILAGWHGRSFLALTHWRNRGYYALISHSRDGEIMNALFRKFGYNVIRGSTGMDKGGIRAAAELAKVLKGGGIVLFAADGAKGPSHIVQRGVVWLAQKGEAEVIPVAASAKWRKLISSWDKYMLPLPFSKAVAIAGGPIEVAKDASEEELENMQQQIGNTINELESNCEREMGHA